jgi:3-phenylpropionate/trans-cinnamate dioxygenase ferredoxin reductase component
MQHYKYFIIGGGMTADAAVRGIREIDANGSIGLISSEPDAPYDRPPLTKSLWKDKSIETVWRHTESQGVELILGRTVKSIDVQHRTVMDGRQDAYTYERLLLATGGTPRRLPFGDGSIIYFRTLTDYRWLRALAERGRRFAVIGGGFIGSEIAAALAMNQKEVVMIFPGQGICDRVFPTDLSRFLNGYYQNKGVQLLTGESVTGMNQRGERFALKTSSNREVCVDGVVAGLGIMPNVELAQAAGIKVENGIVVDELLRSSSPDIFAAGDVAAFYNPALEKRLRVEHEDNANTMGRRAGRNMAGEAEPYHYLPSFYSDLFDLGYEAVGQLDARLKVEADWQDRFHKGTLYYRDENRVRGVLLWNVWGQVEAARKLIASKEPFKAQELQHELQKVAEK